MDLPIGVLAVYGALVVWTALLFLGIKRRSFGPFLGFGIAFLLALNVRYLIDGAPASIAFFIGIYDVLDNLGVSASEGAAALASCPDNACTVWGDIFLSSIRPGASPSMTGSSTAPNSAAIFSTDTSSSIPLSSC